MVSATFRRQITLDITFRNITSSRRQKPPINNRTIQVRPSALARKERASATNHIKTAIFRIIAVGLYMVLDWGDAALWLAL